MNTPATRLSVKSAQERWFYTTASIALLVLTFVGFKFFYLEGKSFPGRPMPAPIHTLLVTHGILMTLWMLLSVVQPLLVATGRKRIHMMLGRIGAVLAVAMVFVGLRVGIEATRVNPPDLRMFGLARNEFMAVPVIGIVIFALFVFFGVLYRKRPEVHRPMMFMASLTIVSAALGRIPLFNDWYAGTWMEELFTANLITVLLGGVLLVGKCLVAKSFDRWFATAYAALTFACVAISLGAKTPAWEQFALFLLR